MGSKHGWKPYVIGAASVAASVAAGTAIYFAASGDVGFSIEWPGEMYGIGGYNDAGTMACDAPVDGLDAGDPVDGLWYGDACAPGSPVLVSDFRGKADPGSSITLWRNNEATLIGSTVAGSDGTWVIPGVVIPEGAHTIIAKAVNGTRGTTTTRSMFVDTTPPQWDLDGWEVPADVLPDGGVLWVSICHCPDWCPQGEQQGLQPCPGGYKCGAVGDCHTDYTYDEWMLCRQSRRAGCLTAHLAPPAQGAHIRMYEFFSATYGQAGSWRVGKGSQIPTKTGSTVTRVKVAVAPTTTYVPGDQVLVEDVGTCNLAASEQRAVSAVGADYVDVTPALPIAPNNFCRLHNLSRVLLEGDPSAWPPWTLAAGEVIGYENDNVSATIATVAASSPWFVTVAAPYFSRGSLSTEMLISQATPSAAELAAWYEGTHFPAWVFTHRCYIPPYPIEGVDHCQTPEEWHP